MTPEEIIELCLRRNVHRDDSVTERMRKVFEAQTSDSYGFARSRRGTYRNPAIARDWKWFRAGVAASLE